MDIKKNKISQIYNVKLSDNLNILSTKINEIFSDCNQTIKDMIFKKTNKYSRDNKLTFNDAIRYLFNYCFINNTRSNVVSNLNYDNDLNVHPCNHQKKESKIDF